MAETKWTLRLTMEQRAAMSAVAHGADVYSYSIAVRLREVQRAFPRLLDIGPAMNSPADGAAQQPYFGAILTARGRTAIAALRRRPRGSP